MRKSDLLLFGKTKKTLKEMALPFKSTGYHIIVLKENSEVHYLSIEFHDVPDEWFKEKKPFTFARIRPKAVDEIKSKIIKYLNS